MEVWVKCASMIKKKKTEKETFEINVKNMRLKIEEYWKRLTKRIEDRLNLMV